MLKYIKTKLIIILLILSSIFIQKYYTVTLISVRRPLFFENDIFIYASSQHELAMTATP